MFDQETTQFFQLLRSNTIGDHSSIGLRSVLESNIPANVKTFFRADVEWLRTQEKMREVKSSKFSFAVPEVRLLEEQIDILLVNNFVFTRKDFDATADKCIHFLFNYLCRPQWTLNSFFFDATIRITAEEMLAKLRYCSDYSYYRAVLEKYAESRQRTDVGSEEMKRLLKTIDDEICASASPRELGAIVKPIFDFVGAIRASMDSPLPARVPIRAMIYFFDDKKLTQYADALTALREKDNALELSQYTLGIVLEAVRDNEFVPEPAELMAAAAKREEEENEFFAPIASAAAHGTVHPAGNAYAGVATPTTDDARTEIAATTAADTAAPEPVENPIQPEIAPSPASETKPEDRDAEILRFTMPEDRTGEAPSLFSMPLDDLSASAPHPHATDEDVVQRMMYQRQAGIVEHHDDTPEPPADTEPADDESPQEPEAGQEGPIVVSPPYFSDGDKETIISTLFQGDEALFDEAISTTANALSWDEAIISLDRFFAEHGIDPFSKEAMMFANILESWHRTLSGSEPE